MLRTRYGFGAKESRGRGFRGTEFCTFGGMLRMARLWLFAFLTLMIGAQGVFADTTLCREENGDVALEWSFAGRCQAPSDVNVVHCLKDGAAEAADHCLQCIDVPLPSEKSAKSLSFLSPFAVPLVLSILPDASSPRANRSRFSPRAFAAFDEARTVRLLI